MGYYSQVRSLIYGSEDDVLRFITKLKLENNKAFNAFEDQLKTYKCPLQRVGADKVELAFIDLYLDSIKWYEGYEHVMGWTALLDQSGKFDLQWEIYVSGEEPNDITFNASEEHENFLYAQVNIHSYIDPETGIPL